VVFSMLHLGKLATKSPGWYMPLPFWPVGSRV
jgi:hypothetical protein